MLAIKKLFWAHAAIPHTSLVSNFVGVAGIPRRVIFNPRNRLRLGKYVEGKRYSVAFFSRSYLESWRR